MLREAERAEAFLGSKHMHSCQPDTIVALRSDLTRTEVPGAMFAKNRLGRTIILVVPLLLAIVYSTTARDDEEMRSPNSFDAPTPDAPTDHPLEVVVDTLPDVPYIIGVARWSYQPGATYELTIPGPEVYAVESGSLSLRSDEPITVLRGAGEGTAEIEEIATANVDVTLRAGDHAVVPANATHTLRNDGDEALQFLNVVIFPASLAVPSWLADADLPNGISVRNLVSDVVAEPDIVPPPPVRILVDRATIPTGAILPPPSTADYELVFVEAGHLEVVVDGRVESRGAGEAIRILPGSSSGLRNAGDTPLVVMVLAIEAHDATRATPMAGTPAPST
jgi:quercetin dioxygenase-like cupin family protein